ncbi:hypothetical protein PR001_g27406 [Phytophthora rubi]|uniref:Uncharacterized protein n=1 Tax=Phytophthora rubi TaxID=129364 RepID=A0A6A3HJF5_9STRA|nr:hypothetical protein PR001_g27406 [Phytophthora rubi]
MLTQELAQELAVQELAQELTEELPQKLGEEDFVLALEEKPTQELAVQDMTGLAEMVSALRCRQKTDGRSETEVALAESRVGNYQGSGAGCAPAGECGSTAVAAEAATVCCDWRLLAAAARDNER